MAYQNNQRNSALKKIDLINCKPDELVNTASENSLVWFNDRNLTMTSVRKFFSEVKRIDLKKKEYKDEDLKREIIYLKPILAYQGGRASASVRYFFLHLIELIDQQYANFSKENFGKFVKYLESLISFYKMQGGK
ncbi:MAG: type III-A CRISPR-associated protein Csm2 [Candidatus Muirbacterium halophilum]|nr:type III-A CRISPR-associated protein Csm2 [Candidatus Muirbacterium halophilum]MCK9475925.1 type III-A CRISPR-associated protein Csm2 [Candidatus Muirbacterium halophilum]